MLQACRVGRGIKFGLTQQWKSREALKWMKGKLYNCYSLILLLALRVLIAKLFCVFQYIYMHTLSVVDGMFLKISELVECHVEYC